MQVLYKIEYDNYWVIIIIITCEQWILFTLIMCPLCAAVVESFRASAHGSHTEGKGNSIRGQESSLRSSTDLQGDL